MLILNRFILVLLSTFSLLHSQDWANLQRYSDANMELARKAPTEGRVVFMGNSITESWPKFHPEFFMSHPYIPRGISGQTTPQMLVRFRQDVLQLKPEIVVLLAGTNDIAGNTGPTTLEAILGNIISMCELARANGIKVVLSSVLPAAKYPWKPELKPAGEIVELNAMLKLYAAKNDIVYLDYFAEMADESNGLLDKYTYDGVHPNKAGYDLMEIMVENALIISHGAP